MPDPIRLGADATAPQLTGETLEQRVESGNGLLGQLFTQAQQLFAEVGRLTNDLATAFREKDQTQALFEAASKEATDAKAQAELLAGELNTAKDKITNLDTQLSASQTNVSNLERLCGVKGIDPKDAAKLPPKNDDQPDTSATGLEAGLKACKTPQERTEFYRNNKAAFDKANLALKSAN